MRKIIVIFLVMALYFSCVTIISNNLIAEASSGENYYLDQDYIYDRTKDLSDIINNLEIYPTGTIAKGRYFGTPGELFAADLLAYEMETNLSLIDPTILTFPNLTYREQIQNIDPDTEEGLVVNLTGKDGIFTEQYDILARGLTLNHTGDKKPVDCYISQTKNGSVNYNYSAKDVKIIKAENYTPTDDFLKNVSVILSGKSYNLTAENLSIFNAHELVLMVKMKSVKQKMVTEFEKYYKFNFSEIDPNKSSTYPSYLKPIENVTEGFVFFEESEAFNPNKTDLPSLGENFNLLYQWAYEVRANYSQMRYNAWYKTYKDKLKGILVYDYNDLSYNTGGPRREIPKILINGTIGKKINASVEDYKVDFYINQSLNTSVISYNVIGEIEGTDSSKYVIIGCLYDSQWCQGTVDSAIGMSIVLAIAKYFKDHDIKPKYTLRFVGYSGEEAGAVGAYNYEAKHLDDNITWVIDLNQFGFSQPDVPTTLHLATNRLPLQQALPYIIDNTDYTGRVVDDVDLDLMYAPVGSKSDIDIFSRATLIRSLSSHANNRNKLRGIMFLRNGLWYRHHRDGINQSLGKHEFGDSMNYYSPENVKVISELILNVTKFTCMYSNCTFSNGPDYTFWDSDDENTDYDTINVTYTINTTLPIDQISVRLVVYPKFQWEHPCFPILWRHRAEREYLVKSGNDIDGYINTTIPDYFPKGEYRAEVFLSNSRDNAILDALDSIDLVETTGSAIVDFIFNLTDLDILEELQQWVDDIRDELHIDIIDFIERLSDYRLMKKFLIDILGYYLLSDHSAIHLGFDMAPSNDPPNTPDKPKDIGTLLGANLYKTKATDPDSGDKIRYQWNWNGNNSLWTLWKYNSNQYHIKPHTWKTNGEKTIKVRAKNPWNPNVFSNWSDSLNITANADCYFDIVTGHTGQTNIDNPNVQNSYDPTVVVRSQTNTYQGDSYGLTGETNYTYDFGGITTSNNQSPNYAFNNPGFHYVNLTVNDSSINVSINLTINVVNTSACFSMSQLGAQPDQPILFNDTTISYYPLVNWSWDFDDGNICYEQNISHSFSQPGIYNVTFNVTNNHSEIVSFWQHVYVESNPPNITDLCYSPITGTLGCNVTISADFYDNNESGINNVYVNISYPDGTTHNYSMYTDENSSYDYEYVFNDTMQIGWYYCTIWFYDHATNFNYFTGSGFEITPGFGYPIIGNLSKNICDNISGSNFTMLVNGTAESITAYIQSNQTVPSNAKCMIYMVNDSQLVGTTEQKTIDTGTEADWVTFNFTGTKPSLTTNTPYILACWSNDTCNLSYDNASNNSFGRYKSLVYGNPPDPTITWDTCEPRLYSIYCMYSTVPEIKSVQVSPSLVGFGYNVTITTEVEDYYTLVDSIKVNITFPDNSYGNYSMAEIDDDIYRYVFSDSWLVGEYNFSIWMVDKLGAGCSSGMYSFNVSADATISICTLKDSYSGNESVNITDPPGGSPIIGYELLDNGGVLRIYNRFDSYYFNTSSGIQLTNHYNRYWSHNVLMLGYYNNDIWNLIYRTDELSGFNKDIESDGVSFVNATLWKDLNYGGYDFRLAIRYYLGVDDNELTVIPYIKNLGDEDISFDLGFGWEMKDIMVDMTPSGDYIHVNHTMYYLNQTLDNVYTDLSEPCFYLMENITESCTKSLYLKWDQSLNYKLKVKSRDGQYNAPVTLFVKIGTLDSGQEKYTSMYWYDADQITYYFNSYDNGEAWATTPGYMIDGLLANKASTTVNGDVELCDSNNCSGSDLGTISSVEIRVTSSYSGDSRDTILRPVFDGTTDGLDYTYHTMPFLDSSPWFSITNDPYAPQSWSWSDITGLDCDVEAENDIMGGPFTLYCPEVHVRVTYTPWTPPVVSAPYPSDDSNGIGIAPVLNITVSDPDGDSMDITWLSNSSGSWQMFGTNSSVGNGTYHQIFGNASSNGQWWYWKVNVSDGSNITESSVYKFYTGCESKIVNTGSTSFKGFLLMQMQYYNNSSWVVALDTVNETSPRTMLWEDPGGDPGQHIFALDSVFNGLVNTADLSGFGNGTYRVYAALRDPDGNILVCDDDSELVATYEFTVTFD